MNAHRAPPQYDPRAEDAWRGQLADAVTRLEQLPSGWQQATGTATRTTFDTAAVTLPQLAQAVKALLDDLVLKVKS